MLQTTVGRMFQSTAARFPDRSCLETAEAVYTYAQTELLTDRLAKKLRDAGFRKGSRVGLWCKDTPEFLCLYLAMEKLGCVPVLLNTALTGSEMSALLRKAESEALFLDDGFKGVDFPKEAASQNIENTFYIPDFFRSLPDVTDAEQRELQTLYDAVQPSDPDVIIFTSGTSGISKGVLTTHLSRVNVAKAQADTISMTEADKCCVAIPLFHCFGLTGVALAALYCGSSLYFPVQRRTRLLLESVSVHRCTVFSAVPTLYSAIMARPDLRDFDLSSLRTGYIGGSLYTPEFFRKVEDTLKIRLAPSLGQTEATAGLTFISPDEAVEKRVGSVGRFLEGLEGKIQNLQTGKPQPVGESGEICIRGWSVMTGYVNEPEKTKETIDADGWLHTGDLGWLDEDGCLHLSGRLKELIIRGGENISPGEIEAALGMHPSVREVKAVAVPDAHYGEEVCACVVLKDGEAEDENALRSLAAEKLAYYKIPRYILFFDSLPKTGSGKLALAALQKQAAEALHLT